MSTAARKARKRLDRLIRETGFDLPVGFQHPVKVGTPVQDRFENQPAPQVVNRLGRVSVKRTAKAIARLRARGVEVG